MDNEFKQLVIGALNVLLAQAAQAADKDETQRYYYDWITRSQRLIRQLKE